MSKFWLSIKAVVRFGLMVVVSTLGLTGCRGGQKSVEMGPVETVEAFCKAVSMGQWDDAEALCDSLSMKEYIESQKQIRAQFEKEDEDAMKVVRSIMENTTVTVDDMHKADDKRVVTYTLETNGLSKTKKATLRKEEGAWRVEAITEAE